MIVDMSFIPDGISGSWAIQTYEVPKEDLSQFISMFKTGRGVPGGVYKRLIRNKQVVMSNTPDEIRDFYHLTIVAKGSILINGLGLGCLVKVLLDKPEVEKITVIEKSEDVIKLVAPYFKDERLTIIQADAFEYKPPKEEKYNFVWHDIWDNICADNLEGMSKLHRKYGKKTEWQDSWARQSCKRQRQENKRYFW